MIMVCMLHRKSKVSDIDAPRASRRANKVIHKEITTKRQRKVPPVRVEC